MLPDIQNIQGSSTSYHCVCQIYIHSNFSYTYDFDILCDQRVFQLVYGSYLYIGSTDVSVNCEPTIIFNIVITFL